MERVAQAKRCGPSRHEEAVVARPVRDLMNVTMNVVTEDTPVKEVARRLSEGYAGGIPVVDAAYHVVGVITEADLIQKDEGPTGEPWPLERRARREARRKMRASTAGDLMSAPASVIGPETDVADLARFMRERRLKYVPVCDRKGVLLGAISRMDLVHEFLRDDAKIAEEVRRILQVEMSLEVRCDVVDGVVTLEGAVEHRSQVPMIVDRIRRVAGAIDVVNRMRWADDDDLPTLRPVPWISV
jgi:CBS domain-containing protein